jgi:hypothetical protein
MACGGSRASDRGGRGVSPLCVRGRSRWALLAATAFLAGALTTTGVASAAGPWHGRIVDAETGAPLPGVVVLAYWTRLLPSLGGWADASLAAHEEVVTGADGRFEIAARASYTIPLVVKVSGPQWLIFKPGYGAWRLRGSREAFARGEPAEIEMPRLRTPDERLAFLDRFHRPTHVIEPEQMPRLTEAWTAERRALGLGD